MGSAAVSSAGKVAPAAATNRVGSIPMRTLGRTGERVSAIGLDGVHLGKRDLPEAESIHIIRAAIDAGVNFLDNSWKVLADPRSGRNTLHDPRPIDCRLVEDGQDAAKGGPSTPREAGSVHQRGRVFGSEAGD